MVRTIVDPEEQIAMAAHTKEYVEEMERLIPNCPAAETDFSGKQQMIMKMN